MSMRLGLPNVCFKTGHGVHWDKHLHRARKLDAQVPSEDQVSRAYVFKVERPKALDALINGGLASQLDESVAAESRFKKTNALE